MVAFSRLLLTRVKPQGGGGRGEGAGGRGEGGGGGSGGCLEDVRTHLYLGREYDDE